MIKILHKEVKSIITTSKLPGVDYVINPYIGCGFACKYCYASFMSRFADKPVEEWGSYVCVKDNAVELAEKEIDKIIKKKPNAKILFSSATDSWQGVEYKYEISRKILKLFVEKGFQGKISILTKSHLVLRDIDILKKLKSVEVGMTITSTDNKVSRFLETKAPDVLKRLDALKKLNEEGLETYAFICPVLPHFVNDLESFDALFKSIKEAGTDSVHVDYLNLSGSVIYTLKPFLLEKCSEEICDFYLKYSQSYDYKNKLGKEIFRIIDKYKMNLMFSSSA